MDKKGEKEKNFCLPSTPRQSKHLPPSLSEEFNSVDHLLLEMLSPLDSQDPHTLLDFLLHQSFSVSFAGSSSSCQPFCQPLNALSSLPRPLSYLYSRQPTLKIILTCPMALTTLCSVSSVMSNSVTPWTVAHQAPLFMGFSQQEHWNWLPCPPPRDLLHPGIEPKSPVSLHCRQILIPLSHWESP